MIPYQLLSEVILQVVPSHSQPVASWDGYPAAGNGYAQDPRNAFEIL